MGFATLAYRLSAGIGEVILNRPNALNAYNIQMRDDLWQVLDAAAIDDAVRVLLFIGAGRAFCAGADLTEFGTAPSQAIAREVRSERDVWERLRSFPRPMVAAVHGFAIGAGLEIALMCDLRVLGHLTFLQLPEVSLGMIPAGGGTQTLPRTIGLGPALNMILSGDRLEASEALGLGLANAVVPERDVRNRGRALARRLARLEPTVIGRAKRAILDGVELSLSDGLRLEERLASMAR